MSYRCPNCGSHNTSSYEMAYLSGSHSGYASGTGISSDGPGAFGGHYSQSTHLAAQTAPPQLPVFGCGALLWLLLGASLLSTFCTVVLNSLFKTIHGVWSFPIFFIIGFILIERDRRSRMPNYHARMDEWTKSMVCCRCGYRWLR